MAYRRQNQAVTMYPLFFDPIGKRACIEEKDGETRIFYRDVREGIVVEENGNVRFSMYAPQARTVEVGGISGSMDRKRISLVRDEDGYFSRTVSGISSGFHYHDWFVDGVCVTNPIAPVCYGCFGVKNFFELPKEGEDFWFLKDVPHGDVQLHKYPSGVNGHMKSCYIYTPPSYGRAGERRSYPVLYVQHGAGENETGWIWNGKLNFIMDNLIAEQKCEEMIVVMCSGYAFCEGEEPIFYPGDFDSELVGDCIPYVEAHFAVKSDRYHRAVAGLSLGSAQAMLAVARHQELFAWLGVFSGVRTDEMECILAQEKEFPLSCLFMGCGQGEALLIKQQKMWTERCREAGMRTFCRTYEGYHEWHVWRACLKDYVQELFAGEEEREEDRTVRGQEAKAPVRLSTEILDRQTYAEHMLFFDPVFKRVIHGVDEKGQPCGRYRSGYPGVELTGPGTVCLRIRAGGAAVAEADIWGMGRFPMHQEEGEEGIWTCTIENIAPGFHYHTYWINGTQVVNADAPVGYGGFFALNYLEMPEEGFEEYRLRQIPHGTIHLNYYRSGETGRTKLCYVYTPPAYETRTDRRYPVLYLQHGGGENETGWIWQGKLANLADNLLAQGKMKEMIIVMNAGYSFPAQGEYHPSMSAFLRELPESCVPFIDSVYRTLADSGHRALAGLSMGGMQAQKIIFGNPGLFAWAGIFSGGLVIRDGEDDYSAILLDPHKMKEQFRLLFVACGTEDGLYDNTCKNVEEVKRHQVSIDFYKSYGFHDWTFWRHCAANFLPRLF